MKLNWNLETSKERAQFATEYLAQYPTDSPAELEQIANYILWADKENDYDLPRRYSTWARKEPESLDALLEDPTFDENRLSNFSTIYKSKTPTFSRDAALKEAPPDLIPIFQKLFTQIDELELLINYYELKVGKRLKPPREELIARVPNPSIIELNAQTLNQYTYLKKRHQLVELRTQQFILKDTYSNPILRHTLPHPSESMSFDYQILPLGAPSDFPLIFSSQSYTDADLKLISDYLWEEKPQTLKFDFRNIDQVYRLALSDLEPDSPLEETLKFYVEKAHLTPVQLRIFNLKRARVPNLKIRQILTQEFGKTYSVNYISTIFKQQAIGAINHAAALHEKIIRNIFFEEEFKVCNLCGRRLLRDSEFFTRKSSSKDGFSGRCKECEKKIREEKKK